MYIVEVKAVGGWTTHSRHESYRDAVDQADMVRGRVVCATGLTDQDAYQYASRHQGFEGSFADWQALDDDERDSYEAGAARIG